MEIYNVEAAQPYGNNLIAHRNFYENPRNFHEKGIREECDTQVQNATPSLEEESASVNQVVYTFVPNTQKQNPIKSAQDKKIPNFHQNT